MVVRPEVLIEEQAAAGIQSSAVAAVPLL